MIAVAFAVSIILAQALPLAHARAEPIRIAYRAPSRCPDEAQFRSEIFARTALARSAAEGEAAREFAVDIADRPDGSLSGSLEIHSTNGAVSRRDMTASQCGELVSALALMVALAVDPEGASLSPARPAPQNPALAAPDAGGPVATWSTPVPTVGSAAPVVAPAASALASAAPTGAASNAVSPGREPSAPAPVDATRATTPAEGTTPKEPRHGHWAVGTQALVIQKLVPTTAIGASATVDYDFAPNRDLSLALRFALSTVVATPKFDPGIGATLLWVWARAEGCPVRLRLVGSLRVAPCVGLDAGFLSSNGSGLAPPKADINQWFAAEAAARLGWTFAGRWLAQAAVGALAPFDRDAIVYGTTSGNQTVYDPKPPYVAYEAELGLAGWLP